MGKNAELVENVLRLAKPLDHPRGNRLPMAVWRMMDIATDDEEETERSIRELDKRGIFALAVWGMDEQARSEALRTSRIQQKLGLPVIGFANPLLYHFFDGTPETAHVAQDGTRFFDDSFSDKVKMGCPFALRHRYDEIRGRVQDYVHMYREAGLPLDFVFADWEIDGPIEWNDAWENSKRCTRCRENVPDINDFTSFQAALRRIRSEIQRLCYAEPIKQAYPEVTVGNYAVYPDDGWRYWYDHFEREAKPGTAYRTEQRARYRQWFDEFPLTGFNCALPVVYPWHRIYNWYDFRNPDYHWFYPMLLAGTNACKSAPPDVPVMPFVHWNTIALHGETAPVPQFSKQKYQELLWHLLLRGADTLLLWCTTPELESEVPLVHQVYAASLQYNDFLDAGEPVSFDVPPEEGPVVSGLRLGDRVLALRSDFTDATEPVEIEVEGKALRVDRMHGAPAVLEPA